jgi:hypothetical protein
MCTIMAGPVLYIMAVLGTVNDNTIDTYYHLLPEYSIVPCYLSLAGAAWYLVSSIWARKLWGTDTAVQRHIIMMAVLCSLVSGVLGNLCESPLLSNASSVTATVLYVCWLVVVVVVVVVVEVVGAVS